ncbi:restriction endonuclease subunit S [Nocardia cyriacigeorgica]|uniref:restriction endonuclease subunit S n=1 Tax=Nocardia cyriacigeorgica TaxID=135487 RepID=UPI00248F868E|nr:restriction endonuclease subunit S [Nocardia cyriacigeorgica]
MDVYKNDSIVDSLDFMTATATREQIKKFRIRLGDTLITKDSETADDIGVPAFVEYEADDLICGYHLAIVRPDSRKAVPKYLYWALGSEPIARQWGVTAAGVTRVGIRSSDLNKVTIPLPPLDEQRAIADYLDHETAQIDALVAKQDEFIGLLRERRVAAITSAVEQREPDSSFRRHVINIRQGWSPNAEPFPADGVTEWGILKVGCSTAGVFRPEENKKLPPDVGARPDLVVRRGEIVMSRSNTRDLVGSAAVVLGEFPRLMLSDLNYGLTTAATLDPEFAVYALLTRRARAELTSRAKGTSPSMQKLAQRDVLDIPLWVPGIDEQRAIVECVKAQTARIDALIAKAEELIALAKERRSALITAAVTGQIDGCAARKAS